MKRQSNHKMNSKVLLFILTMLCVSCLIISVTVSSFFAPAKTVVSYTVVPLQNGVNAIGSWFNSKSDLLKSIRKLKNDNAKLKQKNADLVAENSLLSQNKYELTRLRNLYSLDKDYSDYKKIGAQVIGKDTGNWFNIFTINRGSKDGVKKDMNVISDGGLVGIVFDVGKNYAKVRSIIDDESSVSVSFASTSDTGIVSGDLKLMDEGVMNITGINSSAKVSEGDMVATSQISDKFVPGILVGYLNTVKKDSNKLTKSGTIIPVVDFQHINEVLVIKTTKEELKD